MKFWAGAVGVAGLAAGLLGQPKPAESWMIMVGGGVSGYLSPCGCTYPMSGGIRRWSAAARALTRPSRTIVLENGGFVSGDGAQDRLKAEALAEALATVNVTAINLTASEARLGAGEVSQLSQLANAKFLSSAPKGASEIGVTFDTAKGPFLIGGATMRPSALANLVPDQTPAVGAAKLLAERAQAAHLVPILMLDGDRNFAAEVARAVPAIRLIVYSEEADTPYASVFEGKTMLITPGEHGKELVTLSYVHGAFAEYKAEDLGPTVKDDPEVAKIYAAYLRSMDRADLISQVPREETAAYVGSAKCGSCHQAAFTVWKSSRHHRSYADLTAQGHSKDPDCVSCHVTGLASVHGFRDLIRTPDLGYVGCESCHGPGAGHSADPRASKMPKDAKTSCLSCHDAENSPRFDYLTYWRQIKHGETP